MTPAVLMLPIVAMLVSATAPACAAPDPANGAELARQWCAECHIVERDQPVARAEVPSFITIAAAPRWTSQALSGFLQAPHAPMPPLSLSRDEIADLVAYIRSLAPR